MAPRRIKVLNTILRDGAKTLGDGAKMLSSGVCILFGKGSSNERFSVVENLPSAPVPLVNPMDVPEIPFKDQLLGDEEVQSQLPESEVQIRFAEADVVQVQIAEAYGLQIQFAEADVVQVQIAEADGLQTQFAEADVVQVQIAEADGLQTQFAEADEDEGLKDLVSWLLDDDVENAVIYQYSKLSCDERNGQWVAEPHVRVWSNKPCVII